MLSVADPKPALDEPPPPAADTFAFPAGIAQEAFYYLERLQPDASPFNIALCFRLEGPIDIPILHRVLGAIVDRHEALRTQFEISDGELLQVVLPSLEIPFESHDLSDLSATERDAALLQISQREARKPFDLGKAPLLRTAISKISPTEHILDFTIHHAVFDGWSIGVLIEEITALYEAFQKGRKSPLPALPLQYPDFAVWQRELVAGSEVAGQIEYWKNKLRNFSELDLPTDRPRPALKKWNGDIVRESLPVELTDQLGDIARKNGATLFHVFLSAFKILFQRYTDSTDILLGTTIAGRNRPELEPLMGIFINSLVLRTDLSGNPDFHQVLQRVRNTTLEAIANQEIPFESLVRTLQPERDPGRNPLFQVNFTHQRAFVKPVTPGTLSLTSLPSVSPGAIYDLHFTTIERDGVWRATCEFCTDIFDRTTTQRMLGHFHKLLEGIAADPTRPVNELPLLTGDECSQIDAWAGKTTPYPRNATIGSLFVEIAAKYPGNIALSQGDHVVNYRELHAYASRVAQALRSEGVRPGSMVAIASSNSPEIIGGLLAILLAGGAYVPVDPDHPAERIHFLMDDAGAGLLLAEPSSVPNYADGRHRVFNLPPFDQAATPLALEPGQLTALHPAYVLYTSGSTGLPKGVVVPHRALIRLVRATDYMNFGPDEVFLQAAPLSFDASTFEIWAPLLNGGKLVLMDRESSGLIHIARTVRERGVTTLWLTAGLFQVMVDEHLDDLKGLRNLLAGGDVLPVAHVRRAFAALPSTRLINGYGPTENTTFTTCHTITAGDLEKTSIPIGRPIANTTVFILDRNGQQTPIGVPGEIFTGGDGLALGYARNPELTSKTFVPNPLPGHKGEILYRTGDRACWRDGGFIEFLGRRDRQVKIRGVRIEPGEVETILSTHPTVGQCRVGIHGGNAGSKTLVAWVCPAPGAAVDRQALAEYLADRLPPFLCPDAIVVLATLPLTPNGKINVEALPDPSREARTRSASPVTETEKQLALVWCELLEVSTIGRDDNFFHLGGHSLLGLKLFSRILHLFEVSLPLATLLKAPSLRTLAITIEAVRQSDHFHPVLATIQRDGHLSPFFCVHGGDGGIIFYRNLSAHLAHTRPLLAIEAPALRATDRISVGSIEETAVEYLQVVRKRQPCGPYFLGGYSFGGAVAYEMARILQMEGDEVAFLVLFDTLNPAADCPRFTFPERLQRFWNLHSDAGFPRRTQRLLAHGFRRIKERLLSSDESENPTARQDQQLLEAHRSSLETFRPRPYDGKLTLFRTSMGDEIYKLPPDYGWRPLVRDLDVVAVRGHHLTIFDPEHVKELATEVQKRLARHV